MEPCFAVAQEPVLLEMLARRRVGLVHENACIAGSGLVGAGEELQGWGGGARRVEAGGDAVAVEVGADAGVARLGT